ncbi:UNVERIFIED_CONTAM: hypothetical protein Cloal_0902 [Acetivibrio alkalicellulosi]
MNRVGFKKIAVFFLVVCFISSMLLVPTYASVSVPNGEITPGVTYQYSDGQHRLVFQRDGNVVKYSNANGRAVWSTDTHFGSIRNRYKTEYNGNIQTISIPHGKIRFISNNGIVSVLSEMTIIQIDITNGRTSETVSWVQIWRGRIPN